MKKSLIAMAVASAALVASTSASAVTVYDKDGTSLDVFGRVQAVFLGKHSNQNGRPDAKDTLQNSGRLGIKGRSKVNDFMDAFFHEEWDMNSADKHNSVGSRDMYVGLDFHEFGSVKFGRFQPAILQSVFTEGYEDFHNYSLHGDGERHSGQIMYTWKGYGVKFDMSVQTAKDGLKFDFGNRSLVNGMLLNISGGVAASLSYTSPDVLFGPIKVAIAGDYYKLNKNDEGNVLTYGDGEVLHIQGTKINSTFKNLSTIQTGLAWGNKGKGFYAGLGYSYRVLDSASYADDIKVHGFEAAVSYGFDCGVELLTGYMYNKVKGIHYAPSWTNKERNTVSTGGIPVQVKYNMSKNFQIIGQSYFETKNEWNEHKNNQYELILRYNF